MQREFRHLGASPTYLLNSGLGLLFLLAAAVLLVIRRAAVQDVIAQLPELSQSLAVMLTMFGAWGAMLALGALWLMLLSEILLPQTYLLCISLAVLALDGWLLHWLKTSGAERFSHLT